MSPREFQRTLNNFKLDKIESYQKDNNNKGKYEPTLTSMVTA